MIKGKDVDIKFSVHHVSVITFIWYAQSQKTEKSTDLKLWRENLKSDGQNFHQYQQNEQSSLTLTHWTQ